MAKTNKEEITVEAELEVNGKVVRRFENAWALAMSLPVPVSIKFRGFVRKED